ncbi:MAG: head-tail connector protein [Lactobacillaceae bacterium]|jgi:uncharacterized phage protein (predicted DNA packaging)|nr:head-tail connector protein [Lactobacillaceae bacterium]
MEDLEDTLLSLVKDSLRKSTNDEDDFIRLMISSAKTAVIHAVGNDEDFYNRTDVVDVFKIAVLELAVNNYMQRASSSDVNLFDNRYGYDQMLLDLKATWAWVHAEG